MPASDAEGDDASASSDASGEAKRRRLTVVRGAEAQGTLTLRRCQLHAESGASRSAARGDAVEVLMHRDAVEEVSNMNGNGLYTLLPTFLLTGLL